MACERRAQIELEAAHFSYMRASVIAFDRLSAAGIFRHVNRNRVGNIADLAENSTAASDREKKILFSLKCVSEWENVRGRRERKREKERDI